MFFAYYLGYSLINCKHTAIVYFQISFSILGHLDVIKLLAPLTNNPNPHDGLGDTPLHLAIREYKWRKNNEPFGKIVEYLLPYSHFHR